MSNPKTAMKTQQALQFFQQGQIDNAQKVLEKLCPKDKKNDLAWLLLATIYFQKGDLHKAEKGFIQTVNAQPSHAEAWNNLGVVRERLNKFADAEKAYRRAIKQRPDYANAYFHLGNILQQQEKLQDAEHNYKQALTLDPNNLKTLVNYSQILERNHDYSGAIKLLERALQIAPDDLEATNNIGYVYRAMGQLEQSIEWFEKAIHLQEHSSQSLINLGVSQLESGNITAAMQSFHQAQHIDPTNAEAACYHGKCFEQQGDPDNALKQYEKATRIDPSYADGWNSLGALLKHLGRDEDAERVFSQATEIDPTYSDTRYNLAVTHISMGRYADGFNNYVSRPSRLSLNFPTSIDALDLNLEGKKVFINKDQGIGDEIFFLRFAPEIKSRGAHICYRATNKIAPLLKGCDALDTILDENATIPQSDIVLSAGDLPHVLGLQNHAEVPLPLTLKAEEQLLNEMRDTLAGFGPPPYFGVTWRGGTKAKRVLFKEIPLNDLASAISNREATFISIQRQPQAGEQQQLMQALDKPVHDLSTLNEDLPRMLALLELLDEYVGVSNANMHLRASLGKTARVLVPHPPEWRWCTSGNTSPWFPGFTVYRQEIDGSWDKGLNQLKNDLQG